MPRSTDFTIATETWNVQYQRADGSWTTVKRSKPVTRRSDGTFGPSTNYRMRGTFGQVTRTRRSR